MVAAWLVRTATFYRQIGAARLLGGYRIPRNYSHFSLAQPVLEDAGWYQAQTPAGCYAGLGRRSGGHGSEGQLFDHAV